jgi:hypothetical protein
MIPDVSAVDVGAGLLGAGLGGGEAEAIFATAIVVRFGLFHAVAPLGLAEGKWKMRELGDVDGGDGRFKV